MSPSSQASTSTMEEITATFSPPVTATTSSSSTSSSMTTSLSPSPTTTAQSPHATGENFCGLPGSPCLGGRDESGVQNQVRDASGGDSSSTLTKHITLTITSTTTTTAPIPASLVNAALSYYNAKKSSVLATLLTSYTTVQRSAEIATEHSTVLLTRPTVTTVQTKTLEASPTSTTTVFSTTTAGTACGEITTGQGLTISGCLG